MHIATPHARPVQTRQTGVTELSARLETFLYACHRAGVRHPALVQLEALRDDIALCTPGPRALRAWRDRLEDNRAVVLAACDPSTHLAVLMFAAANQTDLHPVDTVA